MTATPSAASGNGGNVVRPGDPPLPGTNVSRMSRRNLIPLAILAALVVLTAVFAVVGATSAPSAETVTVQNASTRTFGTPTGSVSFIANVTNSAPNPTGRGTLTQQRLVQYAAPANRIVVYQVTSSGTAQPLGEIHGAGASCVLSAFSSIVGGSTAWAAAGDGHYTRAESLAVYSARVPNTSGTTCAPQPSLVLGQVNERALVKSDYLVAVGVTVVVPAQTVNGRPTPHVVEGEQLVMIRIGNTPVRTLGS